MKDLAYENRRAIRAGRLLLDGLERYNERTTRPVRLSPGGASVMLPAGTTAPAALACRDAVVACLADAGLTRYGLHIPELRDDGYGPIVSSGQFKPLRDDPSYAQITATVMVVPWWTL